MRLRFTKEKDIHFISHHDLMKVFERAVRRAGIPVAMSKGFNPHPKLSIPLALSVGVTGKDEIFELELIRPIPPEVLTENLGKQLPKEIQILSSEILPDSGKDVVRSIVYEVIFSNTDFLKTLKIDEFLQKTSILVDRTKDGCRKLFNIRPSIEDIQVRHNRLVLMIRIMPDGMARPDEILCALSVSRENEFFEIIRTKVNLSSA
ncbi:MAG: TIGR03936 family radical SAM-associated protein [Candidatus Brocadiaceae baterium WH-1]|nr:MAG: TIGR03936 family radical SAM-associated protein [Candidatus Jettenia sp. AMX2]WKZ23536.1 MAG: TIGR03936 family radical SAM-associated protein [Candidatus Jettenia sp. AMX2]